MEDEEDDARQAAAHAAQAALQSITWSRSPTGAAVVGVMGITNHSFSDTAPTPTVPAAYTAAAQREGQQMGSTGQYVEAVERQTFLLLVRSSRKWPQLLPAIMKMLADMVFDTGSSAVTVPAVLLQQIKHAAKAAAPYDKQMDAVPPPALLAEVSVRRLFEKEADNHHEEPEKRVLQASLDDSSSSPDLGAKQARRTSTPTAMQFRSADTSVNESKERDEPASTAVVLISGSSSSIAAALEPFPHADMGQQPLRELVKLVQHHKQHLLVHGAHPVALEHMLECALLDTDAALHTALAALELASSVAAHGLQEAANQALGFAEQALQKTIEKLATTQTLVLEKLLQLASYLRQIGFFVVVALTKPFEFEGRRKVDEADALIEALQDVAQLVVAVAQDDLMRTSAELTINDASAIAINTLEVSCKAVLWALGAPEMLRASAGTMLWHGRDLRQYKRLLSPPLEVLLTCPGVGSLGRGLASLPLCSLSAAGLASGLSMLAEDAVGAACESPFLQHVMPHACGVLCVLSLPATVLSHNAEVPTQGALNDPEKHAIRAAVQVWYWGILPQNQLLASDAV
eukprot:gene11695-11840_t